MKKVHKKSKKNAFPSLIATALACINNNNHQLNISQIQTLGSLH